jgi:hypothetical protein
MARDRIDRFTKAVETYYATQTKCCCPGCQRDGVARLLAKEAAYQRARFRKIVKKELLKTWQGDHTTAKAMNIAHRSACNCILVALLKGRAHR